MAEDVTYSGTVAGAIEATILGIPDLRPVAGLYRTASAARIPYETSDGACARRSSGSSSTSAFPTASSTTSTFPNRAPDAVDGVMITAQGKLAHGLHIDERFDGRGNQYFWLAYRRGNGERSRRAPTCTPLERRRHLGDARSGST